MSHGDMSHDGMSLAAVDSGYSVEPATPAPETHRRGWSSRPDRADRAAQRAAGRSRGACVVTARTQPTSSGPAFGRLHRLHRDAQDSGTLNEDNRTFTKQSYNG